MPRINVALGIATAKAKNAILTEYADQQAKLRAEFDPTGKTPSMERIVRPFLLIDSAPPAAPVAAPPLPGEGDAAFISWGKASSFIRPVTDPVVANPADDLYGDLGGGVKVNFPKKKPTEEPDDVADIAMTEIRRETKDVRIEDPSDSAVYVIVKRIEKVWMRNSENGKTYRFEFKNT